MGRITVSINGEVVRRFKETAKSKFGAARGAYKKAVEEAIQDWIKDMKPLKYINQ